MITQTATIKDKKISLPKELWKTWEKADNFLEYSDDSIMVKKVYDPAKPSLKQMMKEFQRAFKGVTKQEVDNVIKEVRNELYSKK